MSRSNRDEIKFNINEVEFESILDKTRLKFELALVACIGRRTLRFLPYLQNGSRFVPCRLENRLRQRQAAMEPLKLSMPKSRSKISRSNPVVVGDIRQSRLWNHVLFATLLLWTFLSSCVPLFDTDFWWHLKTGNWILNGGGIPSVDLYTFADAGKRWIDLHWGFQVMIAVLYRLGGVSLVTLAKAGILTAVMAVAWFAGGLSIPAWKKSAIWLMPLICIIGRGLERPELLSQLFLAIWLWIATRTDQKPNWIWWLPLLMIVWVNCHALFVLGLVVSFCYVVDALARHWLNGRFGLEPRTAGPTFHTIWIVGGLVIMACFVNPYFEQGALFPLTLYRKFSVDKDFYSQTIAEFRPPFVHVLQYGIGNLYLLSELGVWLLTSLSFIQLLVLRRRWSLFRLLMFAGFSHLAWQASRNTNIFALVSGFIACENFADAQASLSIPTRSGSTPTTIRRTKWMCALYVGLCLAVVSGLWNEIGEKNKPFGLGEAKHWFIHDAAKFAGQGGFPKRAFVGNIGQADVYVYHNGPERKVFMDARLEVCTRQTFERFYKIQIDMAKGSSNWESYFRDGELPVVILDSRISRSPINGLIRNPSWRLVFADRAAAVFLPVARANELNLPTADPTPLLYPDGPPKGQKVINMPK